MTSAATGAAPAGAVAAVSSATPGAEGAAFGVLPPLVFADMDDTFLATDKHIPDKNLRLLDALAEQGSAFVPCTGRPVAGVPDKIMAHPATRYAVGSNGSVIYDVRAHKNLHSVALDKGRVLALYERVRGLRVTFDVFADGAVYAERERYEAMGEYGIDEPSLAVLRRVRQPIDLSVPQILERSKNVEKITCFWCAESDRAQTAEAIVQVGGLSKASGHPKNFELQAPGVSKGFALEWLCGHLGVPVRESVAFGDAENDIPLLEAAGDGVAMANATPAVLAVCNHVTLSCDEAGVAAYLEGRRA